eukprot:scaffold163561_cov64-Cyclotella_meneghiniana.AAC.3
MMLMVMFNVYVGLITQAAAGSLGVGANTVFHEKQPAEIDESEIFVFGRVGDTEANKEDTEAVMTPTGELVLALGVDVLSEAGRG